MAVRSSHGAARAAAAAAAACCASFLARFFLGGCVCYALGFLFFLRVFGMRFLRDDVGFGRWSEILVGVWEGDGDVREGVD